MENKIVSNLGPLKFSIITTNFNGARFLEDTILSVLNQSYQHFEYIVIDGGSTDGSQKIIEKYQHRLAYWESSADRGFAHAYNKGFAQATGDIFAYLNSDDLYCPWALEIVARCFSDVEKLQWITTLYPLIHTADMGFVAINPMGPVNRKLFYRGVYGRYLPFIQQESTFWSKSLWYAAGGALDESLHYAIDTDLWARFFHHAELYSVATPIGGFRFRNDSKSGKNIQGYYSEMSDVLKKYPGSFTRRLLFDNYFAQLIRFSADYMPHPKYFGNTLEWDLTENCFLAKERLIEFSHCVN